jgi:hypothetical protein
VDRAAYGVHRECDKLREMYAENNNHNILRDLHIQSKVNHTNLVGKEFLSFGIFLDDIFKSFYMLFDCVGLYHRFIQGDRKVTKPIL